ncbi:MAG: helix-turn-helix transcriptional regulator [Hyphomicrobiales bacterium]|nr:helix-turn-helix transcriptional regulator [Hyphomicrobiales bacterium]
MNVRYFTNAEGEEMAVLPRADLESMTELADHATAISNYRSGKLPGLTPEETRSFIEAPSALAFWRRYRGFTQHSLSQATDIAQNYLSELENAKRTGSVEVWLKLSKALQLPVEELVEAQ